MLQLNVSHLKRVPGAREHQQLVVEPGTVTAEDESLVFITELIRPKTPASVGGGFQRAVKSSMDSANIQRGLNPPLNEV
ncbi:MAG: hypothetical protein AB1815_14535, partial [Bacillota bacterium]